MYHTCKFVTILAILSILLSACAAVAPSETVVPSSIPTAVAPQAAATNAPVATATLVPPTAAPQTATVGIGWVTLPDPLAPASLPTELGNYIQYVEPPADCAVANDANQTCSTRKGQPTNADFTLKSGQAIRLTGDMIVVTQNGKPLMGVYDQKDKRTAWVIVNAGPTDIQLHMTALFGSFRGYFVATLGQWTMNQVVNLRDLAIYQYIVAANPLPTPAPAAPTPVWNCENSTACHASNVNLVIWDGGAWYKFQGFYNEDNASFWNLK